MKRSDQTFTQADRKAKPKFTGILIAAGLIGVVLGFAGNWLSVQDLDQLAQAANWWAPVAAVTINAIALAAVWTLCGRGYRQAQTLSQQDSGEDEHLEETIDKLLNRVLMATAALNLITFSCFGLATLVFRVVREDAWPGVIPALVVMLVSLVELAVSLKVTVSFQRKAVNLTRQRNPEKEGSVYQLDFNKVWVNSCDEAEQAQIYRAGFAGYKAASFACPMAWLVATLGCLFGFCGPLSVLLVCAIWAATQIAYFRQAMNKPSAQAGSISSLI